MITRIKYTKNEDGSHLSSVIQVNVNFAIQANITSCFHLMLVKVDRKLNHKIYYYEQCSSINAAKRKARKKIQEYITLSTEIRRKK